MAIDTSTPEPRSRRAILAGAIGGVAAMVAGRFASPDKTSAVHLPGFGHANAAGAADTSLTTSSAGTALLVTQNGAGTALRGSAVGPGSIAGFFTANNGTGVSGVTGNSSSYGVFAANNGAGGTGGALRASGVNNHGIVATTASYTRWALIVRNTGSGAALWGDSEGAAPGGFSVGVQGTSSSDYGAGVTGYSNTTAADPDNFGAGVRGQATGPYASGVYGIVTQADGRGVYGENRANSATSYGVVGKTTSTTAGAAGVFGIDNGGAALTNGVRGHTTSTGGAGVQGNATQNAAGAVGVYGTGTGAATGVWGTSVTGTGVYGTAASGYGVYATNTAGGATTALYSNGNAHVQGNLNVTGTLTKGGGTFRIDHPLDPANKFLSHSFVESPEMLNVYSGTATLDARGEARVLLPGYFEALNQDVRYQLTPIGKPDGVLYVKAKLQRNAFTIAGGRSGQEVCWQVTGVRQDAWANAHRVEVEVAKRGADKGRFLYPLEHGQPMSMSIARAASRPTPPLP